MLSYPTFTKPAALGQRDLMLQHLTQLSQQDQVSLPTQLPDHSCFSGVLSSIRYSYRGIC